MVQQLKRRRGRPEWQSSLVCHVDIHASFAVLTGQQLDAGEAPDSINVLDALMGKNGSGRTEIVTEGMQAKTILRRGDWVFISPHEGPAINGYTNIELGNDPEPGGRILRQNCGNVGSIGRDSKRQ